MTKNGLTQDLMKVSDEGYDAIAAIQWPARDLQRRYQDRR